MRRRKRTRSPSFTRAAATAVVPCWCLCWFQLALYVIGSASALARPSSKQNRKKHRPLAQRSTSVAATLDVEIDLWSENNFQVSKRQQRKQQQPQLGGFTHVIGSDDSGGGCIAGPIVTASLCLLRNNSPTSSTKDHQQQALALPPIIEGVGDSKLVSAEQRHAIYELITSQPETYAWTFATRSNRQIDEIGVAKSTLECFQESIESLVDKLQQKKDSPADQASQDSSEKEEKVAEEAARIYSIVDGKNSPKELSIQSRPWVKADSTVYTVALASILARVIRDDIIKEAAEQYPEYGFEDHGGYPTKAHTLVLHQHGPSPLHRLSSKPVQQQTRGRAVSGRPISRDDFVALFLVVATTSASLWSTQSEPASAKTMDPKTGIALPDKGEIEAAVPTDWSRAYNPLEGVDTKSLLGRLDSTSDAIFYQDPRFVEHVDGQAVGIMTKYVSSIVAQPSVVSILDLCCSWTSHIDRDAISDKPLRRVAGLGMNAKELQANELLTERAVQDLNQNAVLPYKNDAFDLVLCQLSIDYLTQPLQVCAEIGRVLKPGGTVHFIFSNRLFLSKAVALWTGADDVDHAYIVGSYLHYCGGGNGGGLFKDIQALDLSIRKGGRDQRIVGDPVYVVLGTKK